MPTYDSGMTEAFLYSLVATFFISLIAIIGIFILPKNWSTKRELRFISFAAGVLLAAALLELLPEAVATVNSSNVFVATLGGLVGFFYLERFIRGTHRHQHSHSPEKRKEAGRSSTRYLVLIGDGIHNFVDGVAIAASFIVSPALGLATTLAVAAHEIPQEIADYSVLVRGGFSRRKALVYNFLSGLMAVLGASLVFILGDTIEQYTGWILATTAGLFLYIAAADLIPELQHGSDEEHSGLGISFMLGLLLLATITMFVPHKEPEEGHGPSESIESHEVETH